MRIALSRGGLYMTAEKGGVAETAPGGEVTCNRSILGAWETWTVEARPEGGVALKSSGGFYLCALGAGGGGVVCNRAAAAGWETLTVVGTLAEGASVGLRTDNGHFLGVQVPTHDKRVDAVAGSIQSWKVTVVEADVVAPRPPDAPALTPLHVEDVDIKDAANQRVVLCEVTNFTQFYRFVRQEDMAPTLYPGFDIDRVLLSMRWIPEQLGWPVLDMVNDSAFQPLLRDFLTWKRGIRRRTELTVVCDRRDLGKEMSWAARLLNLTYEVAQDFKENLVEFGNEVLDGENALDLPWLIGQVDRKGVVSCSGSGLTGGPVPEPYLDYCAPHLTRGPIHKMLADANMGEQVYGSWPEHPTPTRRPTFTNEMKGAGEADSDSRYIDPRIAKEVARAFTSRNGGCFHATDAVFSRPLGPRQEVCRQAFVDGMRGL